MGQQGENGIAWTDATWNCVRGCSRVSAGCARCYAERMAARFSGPGLPYEGLAEMTPSGPRWTGRVRLVEDKLEEPLGWKRPRRIFVNSMSDLFHEGLSFDDILRVFQVMARARHHTFQVLTKRPERMLEFFNWLDPAGDREVGRMGTRLLSVCAMQPWPLRHVWLGVSVEDQRAADDRIPLLLQTPAAVRFLSCEPLLGPVDLLRVSWPESHRVDVLRFGYWTEGGSFVNHSDMWDRFERPIQWVIAGGESGPGARPMDLQWLISLVNQCRDAGTALFVKQFGDRPVLNGAPFDLAGSKGGAPEHWPEAFRVREFPGVPLA